MKFYFITSDDTQLIFVPENDREKILLESLTNRDVTVNGISAQMNILGKPLAGGIIIQKTGKVADNLEKQPALKLVANDILEEVS
jgi:hypothetical protein